MEAAVQSSRSLSADAATHIPPTPTQTSAQTHTHPFRREYTLRDVYNAAATEKDFDYVFWLHVLLDILGSLCFLAFSKTLVLTAVGLMLSLGYAGFFVVVPIISEGSSFWYAFHCVVGGFLYLSILFNYAMAVTTKPGKPSDYLTPSGTPLNTAHNNTSCTHNTSSSTGDIERQRCAFKHCKKCAYPKPPRAHHCSVCGSCVMRMDHHCPWLANCVGLRNYRFFFSFLCFVTLGTLYLAVVTFPVLLRESSALFAHNIDEWSTLTQTAHTPHSPHTQQREREDAHAWSTTARSRVRRQRDREGERESRRLTSAFSLSELDTLTQTQAQMLTLADSTRRLQEVTETNSHVTATQALYTATQLPQREENESERQRPRRRQRERRTKGERRRVNGDEEWYAIVTAFVAAILELCENRGVLVFFIFAGSSGVALGVGSLFGFHAYLVSKGCTTIEMFSFEEEVKTPQGKKKKWISPYDKGVFRNFCALYGTDKWYIAVLPRIDAPISVDELYLEDEPLPITAEKDDDSDGKDAQCTTASSGSSSLFKSGAFGSVVNRYQVHVYQPFAGVHSSNSNNNNTNSLIKDDSV